MRQLFVLATLLAGALSAQAAYSDYFRVQTIDDGEVENGGTVMFCKPSHVNAGFYNDWYDYELEMLVKNVTEENLNVTCTLAWGSYPTAEEYIEHFEDRIPGTEQYVYGFAKMCSGGYCYSPQFPSNLGSGRITVAPGDMNALMCQLLNTPLDLVAEYKLIVTPQGHAADRFECNMVFAPTEGAARKFLGIEGEIIDKSLVVTPAGNSVVEQLSEIEISSKKYAVSLNPDMAGTEVLVRTRMGDVVGTIAYDDITIAGNKATLHFKAPVTEEGLYTVGLPAGYLKFGTAKEGFDMPATALTYRVDRTGHATEFAITPAAGNVESLSGFTIDVPWLAPTYKQDAYYHQICATLTLPDGRVVDLPANGFEEVLEDPNDFWSPIIGRSYEFDTTYTAIGDYVLDIPAGMFYIDEEAENVNPEWKVFWTIGTTGVTAISGDASLVDVHTVDGMTVISRGSRDRLESLPAGTYIINGKKVHLIR